MPSPLARGEEDAGGYHGALAPLLGLLRAGFSVAVIFLSALPASSNLKLGIPYDRLQVLFIYIFIKLPVAGFVQCCFLK